MEAVVQVEGEMGEGAVGKVGWAEVEKEGG